MDRTEQESQFTEWHAKHHLILHKVANTFASGADREDLVQEMLIGLWKALPTFRGDAKESTFTYRVVTNCALTWMRGQARRRKRESKAFQQNALAAEISGHGDERLELLYESIRLLPAIDRSIITMALDGLSHAEIGEVIGSRENTISVRIHRIRKQLIESIERKKKSI